MAKPEAKPEMVTKVRWLIHPTASMHERVTRLQQIQDNKDQEFQYAVQVAAGHVELFYTEKQLVHPASKDARAVRQEERQAEQRESAREAARQARQQAEMARKATDNAAVNAAAEEAMQEP